MFKKILIGVSLLIVICAVGTTLYGWYLSTRIEERFSARRWSIPSKVYSDTTLLYPGQRINRELFHKKLLNLDYRPVSHRPDKRGDMQITPASTNIFLQDLKTPWQNRQGFPVQIAFDWDRIQTIKRADNGKDIPILELEPEEIMLFFGPERERRQLVSIQEIPEHLIHAVLAAEDSRFFQHRGVDPRAARV